VPPVQAPQAALAVEGFVHTGVASGQSAPEPEPVLPRQAGVTQRPVPTLHTCPELQSPLTVQRTPSVPVLVRPSLLATIVDEPSGNVLDVHVHVPPTPTVAEHAAAPPAVTVTAWPGTPVPVMAGVRLVVVAVPPAGGDVRPTAPATQVVVVVLQ
jgi:hypothetical protein